MVTALNVANSLLQRGFAEDISITPMKLQKLIYFVYRDYYQQTDVPLFSERFETWQYGPVVRSVYDRFKMFGGRHITKYAFESDGKTVYIIDEQASKTLKIIIDNIWNKYKYYNGSSLSAITHQDGGAWKKANDTKSPILRDDDIKTEVSVG